MKKTLSLDHENEENIPDIIDLDDKQRGVYWQDVLGRTHTAILVAIEASKSTETAVVRKYLEAHPELV